MGNQQISLKEPRLIDFADPADPVVLAVSGIGKGPSPRNKRAHSSDPGARAKQPRLTSLKRPDGAVLTEPILIDLKNPDDPVVLALSGKKKGKQ